MHESWEKKLIEKLVVGIEISNENNFLRFKLADGEVVLYAAGDCCSLSWFNDILGVDALLGGTIRAIESIEMPDPRSEEARKKEEKDGDYLAFYGYKITTDKGHVTLAFRNSSNGYYGGSIELADVYAQMLKDVKTWKPITDDWSA